MPKSSQKERNFQGVSKKSTANFGKLAPLGLDFQKTASFANESSKTGITQAPSSNNNKNSGQGQDALPRRSEFSRVATVEEHNVLKDIKQYSEYVD